LIFPSIGPVTVFPAFLIGAELIVYGFRTAGRMATNDPLYYAFF